VKLSRLYVNYYYFIIIISVNVNGVRVRGLKVCLVFNRYHLSELASLCAVANTYVTEVK